MKRLALVFISLFFFQFSVHAAVPAIERQALVELYKSTNGAKWTTRTNWLKGDPCENAWHGVTCEDNVHVTQVLLGLNRLDGTIPATIGELVNLRKLGLSHNWGLDGTIPVEVGDLTQLRELYLSGTRLGGSIPVELGNLTHLEILKLDRSMLDGPIPVELGQLTKLKQLVLYSNRLTGRIPSELGELSNLQILELNSNRLSGSIPVELGKLIQLQRLELQWNQLTDMIPSELGNLTGLKWLLLSHNDLSGAIPAGLGLLTNLTKLEMDNNKLDGSVPAEIGNLVNLSILHLDNNKLSGSIPTELGLLTKLAYLYLNNNQLGGPIPVELGNMTSLERLVLDSNQLGGSIPAELSRLTNLKWMILDNNQLSGSIPAEIGSLTGLLQLLLEANTLSGELPSELINLTSIRPSDMDIRWNALYTDDPGLDMFLNTRSGHDWSTTQTIAPANITVTGTEEHSATLTWDRIEFGSGYGRYRVFYGRTSGGPYTEAGTTVDKTETGLTVYGLPADSMLNFVVQTESQRHSSNLNNVVSDASPEVSGDTPIAPPGFFITPVSGLVTTEEGGTDTFEVSLDTQPNSDVTLGLMSSDPSEGTISDDSLTFTTGNWNIPQLVTVFGVDDDETDDHQQYTIITGAASSVDIVYDGIDPVEISVTNNDDEKRLSTIALEALYNATNGPQWRTQTNWLVGDPCINIWFGVTCNEGMKVIELNLRRNGLSGAIPLEFGDMQDLVILDLGWNHLSGQIPVTLGDMLNLTSLDLSRNELSGVIPAEIGNTVRLMVLDLSDNQLSGSIPDTIGNLVDLTELNFFGNLLNGVIPAELGKLIKLEFMGLASNQLSGEIPGEFGRLTNLNSLGLLNNHLSGSIPAELGNLTSLKTLRLTNNQLSGSIPAELGNLVNLKLMVLNTNQLSGPIPVALGNLVNLTDLDLSDNQLSGVIPAGLGGLIKLEDLNLFNNQLSGVIPAELGDLISLDQLGLNDNRLSGPIPAELGSLTSLYRLFLFNNQLSGSIPAELGNLKRLWRLELQDNQLSGPIPAELGNLTRLLSLSLENNQLNGPIPPELGKLRVWSMDLQGNRLSGQIPAEFRDLLWDISLNLHWNALYTPDADLDAFLDHKSEGDWSATQTVAPELIRVSSVGFDSVMLGWDPIEFTENEGGYRVWYGTSLGGPYADGGITVDKSSSGHTVTGLELDQKYYFVVRTETNSHDDNSNLVVSEQSNEVFAVTAPAKPVGVNATDGTYLGLVRVTFGMVEGATVYRVFRCLDTGQTCGSPIGYPTTGSFDDKNVVPGTVYYYRVRACVKNDCGKFSAANTGFASIQPSTPTGITASDGSYPYRVDINWNAVEGASVYRVFSCLDKGQTCGAPIGFPKGTSFEDKTGAAGTVYYYRVKACNTQHCSKFSVANAGHRSDSPALKKDEPNAILLPDQQVPIPTLSDWGKWFLTLMVLGFGLVMVKRQSARNAD